VSSWAEVIFLEKTTPEDTFTIYLLAVVEPRSTRARRYLRAHCTRVADCVWLSEGNLWRLDQRLIWYRILSCRRVAALGRMDTHQLVAWCSAALGCELHLHPDVVAARRDSVRGGRTRRRPQAG